MGIFKSISIIFFSVCIFSFTHNKQVLKEQKKHKAFNCGFYINKKTSELFLVRLSLNLKCDSTFIFMSTSCTYHEKSSGTWSKKNDTIFLFSDKKTIRKKEKAKGKLIFKPHIVDLTGNFLTIKDSFLIWQHDANYIDTLQEAMQLKYELK